MSWLADSTANKYVKTYFNGFVDVSGGDIIQRNGNFNLTGNIILNGSSGFNKNGFDLSVPTLTANDSLVIQSSFNLKANLASPTFTGVPLAPTAIVGTNTTQVATTAFVLANAGGSGGSGVNTDTQTALNLKANLASPTFTGTVAGITKSMVGLTNVDNTTDLLKPVSTATQTALNLKGNLASPTFTGILTTNQLVVSSGNIALGTNAKAAYIAAIAIGLSATAISDNSIAIGTSSSTEGTETISIGRLASAGHFNSIAIGYSATTGGGSSIAIGNNSSTAATDTVALGRLASAVGQFSSVIGRDSVAKGTSSIAIGHKAFVDDGGSYSIAIGSSAKTSTYSNSVAIGSNALSTANNQITLGTANETVRILGNISNAGLTSALNLKANIDNPTFTGIPVAPTAVNGTNTTQVATTAFVLANAGGSGVNADTQTALNLKANLASPTFTGIPVAPTASAGTNTTQVATTAFVLANTSSSSNGFTTLLASGELLSPTNPQVGSPKQVVMISNSTLLSNSKSILFYARNVVNYGNVYLLFEINGVFNSTSFTDSNSIFVSTGQLNIVGYRYNTNVIRITRLTNTSRYTYETRVAGTGTVNAFGSFDLSGQITGIKVIQANYSSYMGLQPILGTYHLECTS